MIAFDALAPKGFYSQIRASNNLHIVTDRIRELSLLGQEIPNDLILESNKLMNDYNESIKCESNV
jgi:hypothetical protein